MTLITVLLLIAVFFIVYLILLSPFKYPYFKEYIDISGKRLPNYNDYIDMYLCKNGFTKIWKHLEDINDWKESCERKINKSFIKRYRRKQYEQCLDDNNAFQFIFTRTQTRYSQKNYIRQSYIVQNEVENITCDFSYLENRYNKLEAINFECPLSQYDSKNQRKLMTKALRKKIMQRDNYTCQICGKYMPDEVGLQIDHIIPISRGGKTIDSNLQVLCSKCNGKKSNK